MAGAPGNRRVVRGGSFNNTADFARCAYRNNRNPNNRNNNNGFRVGVAAAHSSPCSAAPLFPKGSEAAPISQKGSEAALPEMSPGYWLGDRGYVFCTSKTRERKRGGNRLAGYQAPGRSRGPAGPSARANNNCPRPLGLRQQTLGRGAFVSLVTESPMRPPSNFSRLTQ